MAKHEPFILVFFFPTTEWRRCIGGTHIQDVILGTFIDEVIHLALRQAGEGREF